MCCVCPRRYNKNAHLNKLTAFNLCLRVCVYRVVGKCVQGPGIDGLALCSLTSPRWTWTHQANSVPSPLWSWWPRCSASSGHNCHLERSKSRISTGSCISINCFMWIFYILYWTEYNQVISKGSGYAYEVTVRFCLHFNIYTVYLLVFVLFILTIFIVILWWNCF